MAKIAFISTMESAPWGGSEELWEQTAAALLKQGHQVTASVWWWPEPSPKIMQLQAAGCRIEWRKRDRVRGMPQRVARKIIRRLRPPEKHWLDTARPDLVVISQGDPYTCVGWAEQCRLRAIPYALIVQAAAEHWWPNDAEAALAALCYEAAVASYFVSDANLELVRIQLAAPLAAAKVVRNPFGVSYDTPVAWPEDAETLRLACVGRLEPSAKGQDILFEVLREEKWKSRRLTVSLYGSGPNSATLKVLKDQYGLQAVTFAGFTPNIEEVWRTHHALVQPSRFEGLPITVVEAMLCGRPVIVTNVAGNAELVEDGVTGFIADAPDKKHLDDAMERAWAARDRLREMGRLAREQVRTQVPGDPTAIFLTELSRWLPADAAGEKRH